MAVLRHAHLEVDLPIGWEGRGFARREEVSGEHTYTVLHLANFALPTRVEDYGGGAVEAMRSRDAFVSLLQFGPESVGTPLFARFTSRQENSFAMRVLAALRNEFGGHAVKKA